MTINRASFGVDENNLEDMVLEISGLPPEFRGHQVVREGILDNETMAEQGFAGSTAARFSQAGRISGYMREFGPTSTMPTEDEFNFLAATVAHLFDNPDSVSHWMHDIFLDDFQQNLGESLGSGNQLISAERLEPLGFFDEAVALKVLQGGPAGLLASTVIDFRVGRILGVAFVGTVGDHQRLDLATELALTLEKRIVSVVLG